MMPGDPLARISTVTFDAAGTLFRPHPSVGAVYREVALRFGRDYPQQELERAFHLAFSKKSKEHVSRYSEDTEREFWTDVIVATINAVGSAPEDLAGYCHDLWETFARASRWRIFPGTERTFETLRSRGYVLGIISNWDRRLHSVLHESGLRRYFSTVVVSSEVGAAKPDAKIFRAAELALNSKPEQCLHVGDSRTHDVDGARRCGWRAFRVRHDESSCLDDEIPNLEALIERLPIASDKTQQPDHL